METAEIQASLQSSLFSRLVEDGDHRPPYFEPKPNLSKILEGLLMRLVIFENTIFQLNSLNITVSVC